MLSHVSKSIEYITPRVNHSVGYMLLHMCPNAQPTVSCAGTGGRRCVGAGSPWEQTQALVGDAGSQGGCVDAVGGE